MKIGENITLYAGAQPANGMATEGTDGEQEKRKTLFAGNMNQENTLQDRIAQKKAEAQKQAMKVVGDVWEGRRTVDEDMEGRRDHVKELKQEKKELQQEAAGVEQRKEELERAYEAGEIGQAEYFSEKLSLSREENTYKKKIADSENEIMSENAVVRGTKQELLKTSYKNSMAKAWDTADDIMEAAGDEIMGMVVEDAKDHVDEEAEKREEQAQEIKEEKEEQEEIQEKRQERKEELEELAESVPVEEMVSMDKLQDEVKQEVQSIVDKMKLLAEDIKGAMVDETL